MKQNSLKGYYLGLISIIVISACLSWWEYGMLLFTMLGGMVLVVSGVLHLAVDIVRLSEAHQRQNWVKQRMAEDRTIGIGMRQMPPKKG